MLPPRPQASPLGGGVCRLLWSTSLELEREIVVTAPSLPRQRRWSTMRARTLSLGLSPRDSEPGSLTVRQKAGSQEMKKAGTFPLQPQLGSPHGQTPECSSHQWWRGNLESFSLEKKRLEAGGSAHFLPSNTRGHGCRSQNATADLLACFNFSTGTEQKEIVFKHDMRPGAVKARLRVTRSDSSVACPGNMTLLGSQPARVQMRFHLEAESWISRFQP